MGEAVRCCGRKRPTVSCGPSPRTLGGSCRSRSVMLGPPRRGGPAQRRWLGRWGGRATGPAGGTSRAAVDGVAVRIEREGGRRGRAGDRHAPAGQPTKADPEGRLLRPERGSGWLVRAARPAGHFLAARPLGAPLPDGAVPISGATRPLAALSAVESWAWSAAADPAVYAVTFRRDVGTAAMARLRVQVAALQRARAQLWPAARRRCGAGGGGGDPGAGRRAGAGGPAAGTGGPGGGAQPAAPGAGGEPDGEAGQLRRGRRRPTCQRAVGRLRAAGAAAGPPGPAAPRAGGRDGRGQAA
jgi:hypothetical protein